MSTELAKRRTSEINRPRSIHATFGWRKVFLSASCHSERSEAEESLIATLMTRDVSTPLDMRGTDDAEFAGGGIELPTNPECFRGCSTAADGKFRV